MCSWHAKSQAMNCWCVQCDSRFTVMALSCRHCYPSKIWTSVIIRILSVWGHWLNYLCYFNLKPVVWFQPVPSEIQGVRVISLLFLMFETVLYNSKVQILKLHNVLKQATWRLVLLFWKNNRETFFRVIRKMLNLSFSLIKIMKSVQIVSDVVPAAFLRFCLSEDIA